MLQQTQVARVLPAYARFLHRFPTLRDLARAPLGDVLREWAGLGYNRRARDLHRIARAAPHGLPHTIAELDALPGVGRYTASAVACFARGQATAFADTNIRRVLGRVFLGRTASDREALAIDASVMPRGDGASWHHALMDIGATLCVSRRPRCGACPLRAQCGFSGEDVAQRRRQSPFAKSDRRVRGAIIRMLGASDDVVSIANLRRVLSDARVPRLVDALASEGLVEVSERGVRLPVS